MSAFHGVVAVAAAIQFLSAVPVSRRWMIKSKPTPGCAAEKRSATRPSVRRMASSDAEHRRPTGALRHRNWTLPRNARLRPKLPDDAFGPCGWDRPTDLDAVGIPLVGRHIECFLGTAGIDAERHQTSAFISPGGSVAVHFREGDAAIVRKQAKPLGSLASSAPTLGRPGARSPTAESTAARERPFHADGVAASPTRRTAQSHGGRSASSATRGMESRP